MASWKEKHSSLADELDGSRKEVRMLGKLIFIDQTLNMSISASFNIPVFFGLTPNLKGENRSSLEIVHI